MAMTSGELGTGEARKKPQETRSFALPQTPTSDPLTYIHHETVASTFEQMLSSCTVGWHLGSQLWIRRGSLLCNFRECGVMIGDAKQYDIFQ